MTTKLNTLKNSDFQTFSNEELENMYTRLNSKLSECNHVITLRLQKRTGKTLLNPSQAAIVVDENLKNISDEKLGELHNLLILILFKIKCSLKSAIYTITE